MAIADSNTFVTFTPFNHCDLDNVDDTNDPLLHANPDLNIHNDPSLGFHNICNSLYYSENDMNSNPNVTSSQFHLALLHVNVRSLPKNNDALAMYLHSIKLKFQIIALTETWISDETCNLSYLSSDFNHVKVYRKHRKGGGVSLFIHDSIDYREIPDLSTCNEHIECIFIEIDPLCAGDKAVVIGAVYRPPNTNIASFLDDHLTPLLSHPLLRSKHCYILGDFNVNLLNYETHQPTANFIDIMFESSFIPLINRPTRISMNSATLIDNIFTNCVDSQNSISGILATDISDHLPIFHLLKHCRLTSTHPEIATQPRPLVNSSTLGKMNRALLAHNWHPIIESNDLNEAYTQFTQIINKAYIDNIPQKTYTHRKQFKPWLTSALLKSIQKKNKLYTIYLKHKTIQSKTYYKRYKNKLTNLLRAAEKRYYFDKIKLNQSNLKNTWKVLKEIIGRDLRKRSKSEFIINNTAVSDSNVVTNEFNKHFVGIGPDLVSQLPQNVPNPITYMNESKVYPSLFLSPTTSEELNDVINNLKHASAGYDNLTLSILKHIFPAISRCLTHLVNLSMQSGEVPDEIKIAKVIPIFKSNDPSKLSNYRPISILPILSKIFEKVIYTRLERHLIINDILSPNQFGFRKGHSTSMAVTYFVEQVYDILEDRHFAIATFLDLSKAFDLVNHNFLLQKLSCYGIRGTVLAWFKNYLANRRQYVFFKGAQSAMQNITCGVPQGSILGPLLFLIFINDLSEQSTIIRFILYADDTTMLISGDNIRNTTDLLNRELLKINQWFKSNHLFINIAKTNFLVFSSKPSIINNHFQLRFNNTSIKRVDKTKFLGVVIDNKLNWREHITHVKNKISKCIGILQRAKDKLNTRLLIVLYNTLILPHFTYCITVWGRTYKKYINQLSLIQKKTIRIIMHTHRLVHTAPLFQRLNLLTLDQLHTYHSLLLAHKVVNRKAPVVMNFLISTQKEHQYSTRSNTFLNLSFRKLNIARFGFKYHLPKLWNILPEHLKSKKSFSSFKVHLKTYILRPFPQP